MKVWMGILLVAAMITSSGCFDMPSVYPLYTDQTAVAEPRLVGAWQTKDGKEQMFVKLIDHREYRFTYIDDKGEASLWELRFVKLGEVSVADMTAVKHDSSIIPAHHFLALSFDNAALKVWFLDSSPLREKAGKEGLAYVRGKKDDVVLTAPPTALTAFLKKNLADEMKKDADQEFVALK
jgi:hypothetical protein